MLLISNPAVSTTEAVFWCCLVSVGKIPPYPEVFAPLKVASTLEPSVPFPE